MSAALDRWASDQRALAEALGLTLDVWLDALDGAGGHRAGLTAAVIGASMAAGDGMPDLKSIDGPALARRARGFIFPGPLGQTSLAADALAVGPGAERPGGRDHPVIAEAIRRAAGMRAGPGAERLSRPVTRPDRAAPSDAPSSSEPTADAPGDPQ